MSHINISYPTKSKLLYQFLQSQQLYRTMVACRFQLPKNSGQVYSGRSKRLGVDGQGLKWTAQETWSGWSMKVGSTKL